MLQNRPRWQKRLSIIVLTMAVSLLCRTIAVTLFNISFYSYGGEIGHQAIDVGVRPVLVVPAIACLLAWGLLEIFERVIGTKAQIVWVITSVVALLASIAPVIPWSMPGKVKVTLICLHLIVFAVFVPLTLQTIATTQSSTTQKKSA